MVRTLPDTSPLEVVGAAVKLSAAEARGCLAWDLWQAEPLLLKGPPTQGDAGLVGSEPVDPWPLL